MKPRAGFELMEPAMRKAMRETREARERRAYAESAEQPRVQTLTHQHTKNTRAELMGRLRDTRRSQRQSSPGTPDTWVYTQKAGEGFSEEDRSSDHSDKPPKPQTEPAMTTTTNSNTTFEKQQRVRTYSGSSHQDQPSTSAGTSSGGGASSYTQSPPDLVQQRQPRPTTVGDEDAPDLLRAFLRIKNSQGANYTTKQVREHLQGDLAGSGKPRPAVGARS